MKLKELLLENPQLIPGLSIEDDLDNYTANKAKFSELVSLPKQVYKKYDDKRIVYSTERMFFCLDFVRKEVTYYMQYDVGYTKKLGSFLWQSLVWRSKHVSYNKTLPHEIFFDVLVPKYKVVATDGKQTSHGKRFWEYQIKFAQDNNMLTYYYDYSKKYLEQFDSMIQFDDLADKYKIWTESPSSQDQLIIISKKELPLE